jgi:hypothetical protein
MNLFPQRQSQRDFLEYYKTLKDDEEDKGEDLFGEDAEDDDYEEPGEEMGEESGEESDDEEASAPAAGEEEEAHRAFDAARRQEEEVALQALARVFEERAAAEAELDEYDEPSAVLEARLAAKFAAEKAAEQAAKERRLAAAAAQAEQDARAKRTRDALYALYDLESDVAGGEGEGATEPPVCVPATEEKKANEVKRGKEEKGASTNQTAGRYRIKKTKRA